MKTLEDIGALLDKDQFQAVIETVPNAELARNPKFQAYVGYTYWRMERYQEAIAFFSNAISAKKNALNTLFLRGRCFEELGCFDEASEDYRNIIMTGRPQPDVHAHLGFCCEMLGDFEVAETQYRLALSLDPGESLALAGLRALGIT